MNREEPQDESTKKGDTESAKHSITRNEDSVVTGLEYETVFETMDDAVFVFDVEHDGGEISFSFRRNNPAHEEITGITVDESCGNSPEEILETEEGAEVTANFRRCIELEETIEYDETIDHPTGTVEWHTKLTPLFEDGRVMRIIGVSRDITDRKQRERELTHQRKRLQALFDEAPDGVIVHDSDGQILDVNETMCNQLGYTREELLSMDVFALDIKLDEEAIKTEWQSMDIGSMHRLEVEGRHRRKDGSTFPVEVWVSKVRSNGPESNRFVALIRDITDRKERERELERQRAYLESANDMITLIEPDGTIEYTSSAAERILGFDPGELIGENGFEYVHPEDREDRLDDIEAFIEGNEDETIQEFRFQCADGSYRWIESTARNLLDDPDVEGLLLSSRDITDRKAYEQRLSTLHDTTRRIIDAESKQDVAEITVDAAQDLLEFSLPSVWFPVEGDTELTLVANSEEHQTLLEEAGTPTPTHSSDSWLWDVIETDETVIRSPIPTEDLAADVPIQSAVVLPLGEHGIFACGAKGEVEFSDREIRIAEILAQNVRTALNQLEQHEALERQKAFTDDLLDAIEDVVYVLDANGDFEQWNAALEEVTGYQHDEIESMNAADLFAEEDMESVQAAVEETFETGRTRVQLDFLTAEGDSIPYEFIAHTFEDPTGEPVMSGIGRDRSVHTEYEAALEAERDFFERTIESLPYPFYVLNADDYTIEHTNSLANVSEGETCYEVTHNRERPCDEGDQAIACPLSDVSESGEPQTVEHVHYDDDGNERVYQVYAAPIFDADGNVVQMAESNIDVTERVKYEQQLEEQRDNLSVLNQVVRHDIRNDMTVVKGRANLLDEHVEQKGRDDLEAVLKATENAIELTKTARDLSDTMLSTEEDVESVRLDRHLAPPIENARSKFDQAVITVEDRIPEITVRGNGLLEAVFRNLIQNAVVHNHKDAPTVQISTTVGDETLTVAVADNGPGVPDGQKETIFGKGEKGLDSPGTGIGLYLVRTLVDQYGGDVWVEDNDPEGSVFYVELPQVDEESSQ